LIGVVLLLVALGLCIVLAAVFVAAARAKMTEREELLRDGGADDREIDEVRKHRPPIKGWLTCSGIALVLLTGLGGLWFKGCQAWGDRRREAMELQLCMQAVDMQIDWFGSYWDQNQRLPKAEEVPLPTIDCPRGNSFRYVGHRKIQVPGGRLLLVELQPHPDGSRRGLTVDESFLSAGKPAVPPRPKTSGTTPGPAPAPTFPANYAYRMHFRVTTLSGAQYESIRAQVEKMEEGP
jgi:hypothetical protein